jgi:hypothetical protein
VNMEEELKELKPPASEVNIQNEIEIVPKNN